MKSIMSKEELQRIVDASISYRDVAEHLGYSKNGGGTIANIKNLIIQNNIDCSHFKGQGHAKTTGIRKVPIEEYLQNKKQIQSYKLKIRLLEENILDTVCSKCGNRYWLGNPIMLELHHIDGNKDNNNLNNLELLCPNCHAYTDTYKSNNRKNHGKLLPNYNLTCSQLSKLYNIPQTTILDNIYHNNKTVDDFILEKRQLIKPFFIE